MPVVSPAFKKAVKLLSDKEKEAIILKAARRDSELYDMLQYELGELTLQEVGELSADTIKTLLFSASGRSLPKALAKALRKALKEVACYKRITKDAKGEIDLNLFTLGLIFDHFSDHFNSYHKAFYTATARLLLRTLGLVRKNLHEDYHLEYKQPLDHFLQQIHGRHNPPAVALPVTFEVE